MAETKVYPFEEQLQIMKKRWSVEPLSTKPFDTNPHLKMILDFEVSKAEKYFPSDSIVITQWVEMSEGYVKPISVCKLSEYKDTCADLISRIANEKELDARKVLLNRLYRPVLTQRNDTGLFSEARFYELMMPLERYLKPLPTIKKDEENEYLDSGWEALQDQQNKRRKVFLVIDKEAKENGKKNPRIVFYFAMSCGLVQDDQITKLSKDEDALAEVFKKVLRFFEKDDKSSEEYYNELRDYALSIYPKETVDRIIQYAERRAERINLKIYDNKKENEKRALRVNETAPGIELSHFVKAAKCQMPDGVDFSAGAYIFWELIYEKIRCVEENVGLKYVYLFAAEENLDADPEKALASIPESNDTLQADRIDVQVDEVIYEVDTGSAVNLEVVTKDISAPLMTYYKNCYGFSYDVYITLYKPPYDLGCFSMSTTFDELTKKREQVWK